MTKWSAVLLDRDGTVNVKAAEGEYVARPEQLTLLPGAGPAVRRLRDAGIPVFVVTNQRGVARGLMTADDLDAVHARLVELI
ncbi:MAG TPA: HAD-IIIA family hydrolase, partial [Actinoplanes sp.]|nr:HAD-IIIA family hydrolase [Actinoplanes sp.]